MSMGKSLLRSPRHTCPVLKSLRRPRTHLITTVSSNAAAAVALAMVHWEDVHCTSQDVLQVLDDNTRLVDIVVMINDMNSCMLGREEDDDCLRDQRHEQLHAWP